MFRYYNDAFIARKYSRLADDHRFCTVGCAPALAGLGHMTDSHTLIDQFTLFTKQNPCASWISEAMHSIYVDLCTC